MKKPMKMEKRLAGLAAFLPEFERQDFEFGRWEDAEATPDSRTVRMPYYCLSERGIAFYEAMYALEWVSPEIDWQEWARTPAGERLLADPSAIAAASIDDLTAIITTCIRRDRFCDGALAGDFEEGRLLAVVRRAAALHNEFLAHKKGKAK